MVQAGNVIPGTCEYHVCKMSKYISNEQAKPPTNKEKSSFPHLRRITHLYQVVMQPPTNRKNGAQIAHDVKKSIKGIALPFYLGSIIHSVLLRRK